jgi:transposase-like protein
VTIDFKGNHVPKSVILFAVFFYVRYGVSYRDLEEIMAERGVEIDHATLNRSLSDMQACLAGQRGSEVLAADRGECASQKETNSHLLADG